jgi:hypothetical protein
MHGIVLITVYGILLQPPQRMSIVLIKNKNHLMFRWLLSFFGFYGLRPFTVCFCHPMGVYVDNHINYGKQPKDQVVYK